jgi:hypothetical protein
MSDNLVWWDPVYLMFLAIADTMPVKQQQKIQDNLRRLARVREPWGDTTSSNFMHMLANGGYVEDPPRSRSNGHLRLVQ